MNEFVTLLNTFASLQKHEYSKLTPMLDIKFNVASEKYSLAASQLRENIQYIQNRTPNVTYEKASIQILEMMHNAVLDMDHKHHQDYMIGLFDLIIKNLSSAKQEDEVAHIAAYSRDLNKEKAKQEIMEIAKKLNKKEFKHKEAVVLLISQMLSTHDYLVSLKDKYL